MADRLTASTNSFHPYSLEEALAGIAAAGVTSVELSSVPGWTEHIRRMAGAEEIGFVKDKLEQYGLTAVSLAGHSDLVSDSGVQEFRRALGLAKLLGVSLVTTSTGGHDASSAGDLAEQRTQFLRRIRPLCDEAADDGITICFETHGGLLATGAMTVELLEAIGKQNTGINYDPGNVIFYGGIRPEEDILTCADRVVHMHVKDQIGGKGVWNFPVVGTGEIDFGIIFAELDRVGFNGPASIEVEFTGEPWPDLDEVTDAVTQSARYLREFVPN
jgi:sugar phosphate isomerase/epimerase